MVRIPVHAAVFLFVVSLVPWTVSPALAQVGRVAGTVRDMDGEPIKGAVVKAENVGSLPRERTNVTDSQGRWGMLGLQAGAWHFSAQAPGYDLETGTVRISSLNPNRPIDFRLVRTAVRGALDDVDTRELQATLDAADALMAEAKWDEAIAAYRAILAKTPVLTMTNLPIATACRMKKDYPGAVAAYEQILKAQPAHQKVLLELGRTYQEKGDLIEAANAYDKAIAAGPGTDEAAEARSLLGQMKK